MVMTIECSSCGSDNYTATLSTYTYAQLLVYPSVTDQMMYSWCLDTIANKAA